MTCPHAETTAILAVFDEAPPEYADHLVDCADCQAVIAEHSTTVAAITPVLAAAPAPVAARPARAPRRRWPLVALLAAAAAVLFVLRPTPPEPHHDPIGLADLNTMNNINDDLLALELELALMDLED